MICPKCKKIFPDDINECPDCGKMLIGFVSEAAAEDGLSDNNKAAGETIEEIGSVKISDFSLDDVKKKYGTISTVESADDVNEISAETEPEVVKIADYQRIADNIPLEKIDGPDTAQQTETGQSTAAEDETADETAEATAEVETSEEALEIEPEEEAEEISEEIIEDTAEEAEEPEMKITEEAQPEEEEKAEYYSYNLDDEPEQEDEDEAYEQETITFKPVRESTVKDEKVREIVFDGDADDMSPVVYKGASKPEKEKKDGAGLAVLLLLVALLTLGASAVCFVFAFTGMDPLSLTEKASIDAIFSLFI